MSWGLLTPSRASLAVPAGSARCQPALSGRGLEPRGGELLPWVDTRLLGSATPLAECWGSL